MLKRFFYGSLSLLFLFGIIGIGIYQESNGGSPGDDEEPDNVVVPADGEITAVNGKFFARCIIPDNVESVDKYFLEIKAKPSEIGFPSTTTEDFESEMNIHAWVELRGVSVPVNPISKIHRNRSHNEVEKERVRFNKAINQVRGLFDLSRTLIIANPDVVNYSNGDVVFVADVFCVIGGVEINLGSALKKDGYAAPEGYVDWGSHFPSTE